MSMGHRYLKGLGVPQSCEKAAVYYEFAANHAAEQLSARGHAARPLHAQLTNHIPWLSDDDNEAEVCCQSLLSGNHCVVTHLALACCFCYS